MMELRFVLELVGNRAFPRPMARPTLVDDVKTGTDDEEGSIEDDGLEEGATTWLELEEILVDVVAFDDVEAAFDDVETFDVVVGFKAAPRPGASVILDDVVAGLALEDDVIDELEEILEEVVTA